MNLQTFAADYGATLVEIVISFATAVILPKIFSLLHLASQDKRRSYLQDALQQALAYAVAVVAKNPLSATSDLISLKTDIVAIAQTYVTTLTPEALTKLGVNSSDQLVMLLESRFATSIDWLGDLFVKHVTGTTVAANTSTTSSTTTVVSPNQTVTLTQTPA